MGKGEQPRMAPASGKRAQLGIASGWVFAGFAAVAAFFLLTEHQAHFMGALPYLLLALCPLMHLFHGGHRGHGGHGGHAGSERPAAGKRDGPAPPEQRPPPSQHEH